MIPRLLLAAALLVAVGIVCTVAWHWDLRRTQRPASSKGLPRTLTELQRRRKVGR